MTDAQWPTEMALLLQPKQVYGITKRYEKKPDKPATNMTATEEAAFQEWTIWRGIARSTILLGMEPCIQPEYTVVNNGNTHLEMLTSANRLKLMLNIFDIWEELWRMKLEDSWDDDNNTSLIDRIIDDYNHNAVPTTPWTTDTDAADMDSAKIIAKMSEQEHIVNLFRVIQTYNEWKVLLEIMMDKNAMMTATHSESITKLIEMKVAIKRAIGLAWGALLIPKKSGEGGNGGKAGTGGKSPTREQRDNQGANNRKENNLADVYSLPMARAHHQELFQQPTWWFCNGSQHWSKRIK